MQGLQVLFDGHDAFGGLACAAIELAREEYGRAILALPVYPPTLHFQVHFLSWA